MICHVQTPETETVETAQWHTRKENNRLTCSSPVSIGELFFIFAKCRANIRLMITIESYKGEQTMIYKIYYQKNMLQVPVRENTISMYIEADSERSVREKLKSKEYNIEYIQLLEGKHLEHEQASPSFQLEQV